MLSISAYLRSRKIKRGAGLAIAGVVVSALLLPVWIIAILSPSNANEDEAIQAAVEVPSKQSTVTVTVTDAIAASTSPTTIVQSSPVNDEGWTVASVVDGDTLEVSRGSEVERVRLLGVDSPESGSCEADAASAAIAALVLSQTVSLQRAGGEERDRDGRILAYVGLADGRDAGLTQVEAGYAIARYDSRDGYGAHPQEAAYVAADSTAPDFQCPASFADVPVEAPPTPEPVPPVPDPAPAPPAAVYYANCSEVRDAGADPIRVGDPGYSTDLDRDGDGIACE